MATYRPVKTSFWTDDWIASLNAQEKLLYLYLLTNPHTNLCGIYRVSIRYLSFETGLSEKEVSRILQKFQQDGKVVYKDGWIVIINYQKHQSKSPQVQTGIKREMAEIPQHVAETRYGIDTDPIRTDKQLLKPYGTNLDYNLTGNNGSVSQTAVEDFLLNHAVMEELQAECARKYGTSVKFISAQFEEFANYWGETGKKGPRWKQEPAFELKLRLFRWFNQMKKRDEIPVEQMPDERTQDFFIRLNKLKNED